MALNKKNFKINFKNSISDKISLLKNLDSQSDEIVKIINKITNSIEKGGKLLFCGNGGSASDAQHLAAEFLVRLKPMINRNSIPALSLTLDSTTLTACGNDYGFENVFSRALEGLGNKKDILIAISTSGNSKNILKVLKKAKSMKIFSIAFLGKKGGKAKKLCNIPFIVKNNIVARIQETHIFVGHTVLETVEKNLIKSKFLTLKKK